MAELFTRQDRYTVPGIHVSGIHGIHELIDHRVFASRQVARTAIFECIEVFYNSQRIHQTLGYRTALEVKKSIKLWLDSPVGESRASST